MYLKKLEINVQKTIVCVLVPALSMTKVELDLFSDIDMYFLFEKGIRGSASYISKIKQSKQQ